MPCYLLTDAEKQDMIDVGFVVVTGPHSTLEDCESEECLVGGCVVLGIEAYGNVYSPDDLNLTGTLDETFGATLTLASAGDVEDDDVLFTMTFEDCTDDGCEGCPDLNILWEFTEFGVEEWRSQIIQAECDAVEYDFQWVVLYNSGFTYAALLMDGATIVQYRDGGEWDLTGSIICDFHVEDVPGLCNWPLTVTLIEG